MVADPNKWFLKFSPDGEGRPWGDDTYMAKRMGNYNPWDENCKVIPLIGGYEAMSAMRESLEAALAQAKQGKKGYVYIADLRLNPLRDLSEDNPWIIENRPWNESDSAKRDQTALGLILRLMQAGINVRILLWLPIKVSIFAGLSPLMSDHIYIAKVVSKECERLSKNDPGAKDRGIVALDMRVASPITSIHHQKMMVIRVGDVNVAYCGGVDLAYTIRDAPDASHPYTYDPTATLDDLLILMESNPPQFLGGDWQSGKNVPQVFDAQDKTHRWPKSPDTIYDALRDVAKPSHPVPDLPKEVYGDDHQIWHDQHLQLQGPIVKTLEEQFCERWRDGGNVHEIGFWGSLHFKKNQVIFSSKTAIEDDDIKPLDEPKEVDLVPGGSSLVQMWRTIPLRMERKRPPFIRGEFTNMAGIANACQAADELIWIFDQYFFSRPLARLLNHQIKNDKKKKLCVILVLPPYANDHPLEEHHARKLALNDLTAGLSLGSGKFERVGVYNLWHPSRIPGGIYCHAKVQLYDRSLLVCGSANLNRRSFTCDTELNCAILDEDLALKHYRRLWRVLFPGVAWPSQINFDDPNGGWGMQFFNAFENAIKAQGTYLIPDPWWNSDKQIRPVVIDGKTKAAVDLMPPRLPADPAESRKNPNNWTGVAREQDYEEDYLEEARGALKNPQLVKEDIRSFVKKDIARIEDSLFEPSSLNTKIESEICPESSSISGDPKVPGRLDEIVFLIENCGHGDKWPWRVP
ncbi:MAG: phospholipase D-like domain-containing protein [Methanotrichaceae archaeon]|nr:phospholipase D-like domain-containing protein [Methanotrichaceae archaeon]